MSTAINNNRRNPGKSQIYYGWWIVLTVFLLLFYFPQTNEPRPGVEQSAYLVRIFDAHDNICDRFAEYGGINR